jgi:hypothetical protein
MQRSRNAINKTELGMHSNFPPVNLTPLAAEQSRKFIVSSITSIDEQPVKKGQNRIMRMLDEAIKVSVE